MPEKKTMNRIDTFRYVCLDTARELCATHPLFQNLEAIREIFYHHFQDLLCAPKKQYVYKNSKIYLILFFYHKFRPYHTHGLHMCV